MENQQLVIHKPHNRQTLVSEAESRRQPVGDRPTSTKVGTIAS